MLKILTSLFFIILAEVALHNVCSLVNMTFILMLYLDQTFVGSTPITDDIYFCARYFFKYNIHDIFHPNIS